VTEQNKLGLLSFVPNSSYLNFLRKRQYDLEKDKRALIAQVNELVVLTNEKAI
jgi:hypothetical protein